MKSIAAILVFLTCVLPVKAQHHFYLGTASGSGYSNSVYKHTGLVFGMDWNGTYYGPTHTVIGNNHGVGAGANADLLYGYKRFRVGARFNYLFHKNISTTTRITPSEDIGEPEKFSGKSDFEFHFVGYALLFQVEAYRKNAFAISPEIQLGSFSRLGRWAGSTTNYFQAGAGLVLGSDVKGITITYGPEYCLRFSKDIIMYNEFQNPFRIYQSVLFTVGVRGDILAAIKTKKGK